MTNRLITKAADAANPFSFIESREIVERHAAYLTDESRFQGQAERLAFPESEADLAAIMMAASAANTPITMSAARTGITGGAVPSSGWLVGFEKMNRVLGLVETCDPAGFRIVCQPGITLETLAKSLARRQFEGAEQWPEVARKTLARFQSAPAFFLPPDPTEQSASLGGMVACNASGARTFGYGAIRSYVKRLRMILVSGAVLDLHRGQAHANADGTFCLHLPDGSERTGHIPSYRQPMIKNAAGYFARPGMDLIDLFIGSEGTLAAFSEIELALEPASEMILGAIGFFPDTAAAIAFVRAARGNTANPDARPLDRLFALEYFDDHSLDLLRAQKTRQGSASHIPAFPASARAAVYVEIGTTEEHLENRAEALMSLLEASGSSPDQAWTATTGRETETLKAFRHALPETVNQIIGERALAHPGLTKLGTDFAVPENALDAMMKNYRDTLENTGLEYVLFGHIGDNHLHANILPRTLDEYQMGKTLYLDLARKTIELGGTVSAEHGVGKLKKTLLQIMYGDAGISEMREIKRVFDPQMLLNRGNLFDP